MRTTTENSDRHTTQAAGLSRWQAVPLAVGSVAGSGMLVLPSAVYSLAGENAVLVWLAATVLCLPMLLMFGDIVRENPNGSAIESCITTGLGGTLGRCVPVMFLCIVSVGLPAGGLVAGRYVALALGGGHAIESLTACAVLLAALAVNVAGTRANTVSQHAGAAALVVMALVLACSAIPALSTGARELVPEATELDVVLPGVVLAFWAFAGFENLTFLSNQLRRPERDFLPAGSAALAVYGLLTVLLTAAIALRVPRSALDEVAGLLQLADGGGGRGVVVAMVTAIAVAVMVLNAVAWVWGVGRLAVGAASAGTLPAVLARTSASGVPRRILVALLMLFTVAVAVLTTMPGLLVDALAAASSSFLVLYLLCIVSYTRTHGLTRRTTPNLLVLVVLVATLLDSGWQSLYGPATLVVAWGVTKACRAGRTPGAAYRATIRNARRR